MSAAAAAHRPPRAATMTTSGGGMKRQQKSWRPLLPRGGKAMELMKAKKQRGTAFEKKGNLIRAALKKKK